MPSSPAPIIRPPTIPVRNSSSAAPPRMPTFWSRSAESSPIPKSTSRRRASRRRRSAGVALGHRQDSLTDVAGELLANVAQRRLERLVGRWGSLDDVLQPLAMGRVDRTHELGADLAMMLPDDPRLDPPQAGHFESDIAADPK